MAQKKQNKKSGAQDPKKLMQRHFKLVPPLPKGIEKQICQRELRNTCYLFTFRSDGKRYGYCTECKKVISLEMKRRESYDDIVNRNKRHNDIGHCPECGARVTFKDSGRGKDKLWGYGKVIIAQKAGKMLLLRYFDVTRSFRHFCLDRIGKNFGDGEVEFHEEHRLFLDPENRKAYQYTQQWQYFGANYYSKFYGYEAGDACELTDWHKRRSFRTDFAKYGLSTFYGLTDDLLEQTGFKYCPIELYGNKSGAYTDYAAFLLKYTMYPNTVEYMMKCGFAELFVQMLGQHRMNLLNLRAKTPEKLMRLPKHDITQLRKGFYGEKINDCSTFEFLQHLSPLGLSDERKLRYIKTESLYSFTNIYEYILRYTTLTKAENYIKKQTKGKQSPAQEYADYIKSCETLGWDLKEHRILFPTDLHEAHDRAQALVRAAEAERRAEQNRKDREKRLLDEANIDKGIKKRAKALNEAWGFVSDGVFARPAASLEEIILEGDKQKICVGSRNMGYTDRHAKGTSFIFFVRHTSEPDMPLCTVEITNDGTVVQARAYKNYAPPDDVAEFLKKWKAYIAGKTLKQSA